MKLYGKTLWFKRGCDVGITLTFKCNLDCEYCSLKIPTGKRPRMDISTLDDWKFWCDHFPVKVRQWMIGGGEPTTIRYMPELVNYLLDKGYHVTVFSNLADPQSFLRVKKSHRFQITATFHHSDNRQHFDESYRFLENQGYRVTAHEIEEAHLPYTYVKPMAVDRDGMLTVQFVANPDRSLYINCYEAFNVRKP